MGWFEEWFDPNKPGGYTSDWLIPSIREYNWTFEKLQNKVRLILGLRQDFQVTDVDIKELINNFYMNVLPLDLQPLALKSWYAVVTEADVDTYFIHDGVIWIGSTPKLNGDRVHYTQDEDKFFRLFPENQTYESSTPDHVLHRGRLLIFRPPPDAVYTIKFPAMLKPLRLSEDMDLPMQDIWGPYIALGAALDWLGTIGDTERILSLQPFFKYAKSTASYGDMKQLTQTERTRPRW